MFLHNIFNPQLLVNRCCSWTCNWAASLKPSRWWKIIHNDKRIWRHKSSCFSHLKIYILCSCAIFLLSLTFLFHFRRVNNGRIEFMNADTEGIYGTYGTYGTYETPPHAYLYDPVANDDGMTSDCSSWRQPESNHSNEVQVCVRLSRHEVTRLRVLFS